METEIACAVDIVMAQAKRIFILISTVNKLFSFFSLWVFSEEIENMYFVFLSSYTHRNSVHCWHSDGASKENLHFDIKSSQVVFLFLIEVFSKETENMYFVFLSSSTNTRESFMFFLNKDKGDDLISQSMEFHTDVPANAYSHYSNYYSYSGLIPNKRALKSTLDLITTISEKHQNVIYKCQAHW